MTGQFSFLTLKILIGIFNRSVFKDLHSTLPGLPDWVIQDGNSRQSWMRNRKRKCNNGEYNCSTVICSRKYNLQNLISKVRFGNGAKIYTPNIFSYCMRIIANFVLIESVYFQALTLY